MRIFGWAGDKHGCGYYRLAIPFRELRRQRGWDAKVDTVMVLAEAADADLIVGQRVDKHPNTVWWQQQDPGRLVFELDDDLWNVPRTSSAYAGASGVGVQNRLKANIRASGAVTVSTPHLADVVAHLNPNVHVLPNYIEEYLLKVERPRRDRLTIGWAGSATHLPDFHDAAAPLTRFFQKYPTADMHFIGAYYSQLIGRRQSRHTGWVTGVDAYYREVDFDIGIAPLAAVPFNLSKSPIKALEYAALGIPLVASDYGPYRAFVKHGVTGFLCRTDHDWFKYLRMLAEDSELREAMGKAARVQAADHTIQGNAWRYADVYEKALAG